MIGDHLTRLVAAPMMTPSGPLVTASQALSGQNEQAQKAMTRLRQLDPGLRLSNLRASTILGPEYLARLKEGLRKAGLPE